jgi:hypothetical protein
MRGHRALSRSRARQDGGCVLAMRWLTLSKGHVMSFALLRVGAITFFASLAVRLLAALTTAILLTLVGAAPAAAQKYAQIVHTEEPYASAGIYIRYGSQFESLFDRSFGRTAVQLLNRLADAQKNCDARAWNQAISDFRTLDRIAYDYWQSRLAAEQRLLAPYPNIAGFSIFLSDSALQQLAELRGQAFEARSDYDTLVRLFNSIPPWQPCGRRTQTQPVAPSRPAPKPTFLEEYPPGFPGITPPPEGPVRPQDQVMMGGPGIFGPGAQPFVGVNVGGGFQNTNFSVSDTGFNVNGSGVMGGGFGGVLFPIPNTNAQAGFRIGGEGGNITGDIRMPAVSPTFNYTVTTSWMAYQEGMVRMPVAGAFKIATNESPRPQDRAFLNYNYFNSNPYVTGSVGIAESGTSVKGTSGAFSVTDNMVRTGITFSVGAGTPVVTLYNGAVIELFAQYRGTQWISTVNIPGGVPIGSFTNEVDLGLQWRFWGPPPPPP